MQNCIFKPSKWRRKKIEQWWRSFFFYKNKIPSVQGLVKEAFHDTFYLGQFQWYLSPRMLSAIAIVMNLIFSFYLQTGSKYRTHLIRIYISLCRILNGLIKVFPAVYFRFLISSVIVYIFGSSFSSMVEKEIEQFMVAKYQV